MLYQLSYLGTGGLVQRLQQAIISNQDGVRDTKSRVVRR